MKLVKKVSLPVSTKMYNQIQQMAHEKGCTINELLDEALKLYKARCVFEFLAKKGKALAKKKGLKPKDFGGPFAE